MGVGFLQEAASADLRAGTEREVSSKKLLDLDDRGA
jgi:hypothetical protein